MKLSRATLKNLRYENIPSDLISGMHLTVFLHLSTTMSIQYINVTVMIETYIRYFPDAILFECHTTQMSISRKVITAFIVVSLETR